MSKVYEIRRLNLLRLNESRGLKADLARKIGTTSARISQLLADPSKVTRPARITTDVARSIESAMEWAHESLDRDGVEEPAAVNEQAASHTLPLGNVVAQPVHFSRLLLIAGFVRDECGESLSAHHIQVILFVLALSDKLGITVEVCHIAPLLRLVRMDASARGGQLCSAYVADLLGLLPKTTDLENPESGERLLPPGGASTMFETVRRDT